MGAREDRERLILDLARATGQTPEVVRLSHPAPVERYDSHRTRHQDHPTDVVNQHFECDYCKHPYWSKHAAEACHPESD